jgi:hypothetical protein
MFPLVKIRALLKQARSPRPRAHSHVPQSPVFLSALDSSALNSSRPFLRSVCYQNQEIPVRYTLGTGFLISIFKISNLKIPVRYTFMLFHAINLPRFAGFKLPSIRLHLLPGTQMTAEFLPFSRRHWFLRNSTRCNSPAFSQLLQFAYSAESCRAENSLPVSGLTLYKSRGNSTLLPAFRSVEPPRKKTFSMRASTGVYR